MRKGWGTLKFVRLFQQEEIQEGGLKPPYKAIRLAAEAQDDFYFGAFGEI
jgi:hypothetical protein